MNLSFISLYLFERKKIEEQNFFSIIISSLKFIVVVVEISLTNYYHSSHGKKTLKAKCVITFH